MPCTSPFVARVPEQVDVCEDKLRGKNTWPEATEPVLSMHTLMNGALPHPLCWALAFTEESA